MRASLSIAAAALLITCAAAAQTAQQPTAQQTTVQQTTAQQTTAQQTGPPVAELPPVTVVGASPLLGSGVDRDTVPAGTNVLKGEDLTRGGTTTPDPVRALNEQVGGVNLDWPRATPISRP